MEVIAMSGVILSVISAAAVCGGAQVEGQEKDVSTLIRELNRDIEEKPNPQPRLPKNGSEAARALGALGPKAAPAIPTLLKALKFKHDGIPSDARPAEQHGRQGA